jgi:hypothetical protein
MTPATIIREAQTDGVRLALSTFGTIKASGDSAAVNRWVAVVRERKAEIIEALKVGPGDTAIICRWWQICYRDREVEVTFAEPMTRAEILNWNCDAIAAVPLLLAPPIPSAEAKAAIREWLALTGETNQTVIDGALALADGDSHRWVIVQLEKIR